MSKKATEVNKIYYTKAKETYIDSNNLKSNYRIGTTVK